MRAGRAFLRVMALRRNLNEEEQRDESLEPYKRVSPDQTRLIIDEHTQESRTRPEQVYSLTCRSGENERKMWKYLSRIRIPASYFTSSAFLKVAVRLSCIIWQDGKVPSY